MNRIKYIVCAFFCMLIVIINVKSVKADEESKPVEINNIEDFMTIYENPYGNYILMRDIDMRDIKFVPIDFYGTFDGNGHALLNVTTDKTGTVVETTYDGNMKTYYTDFSGFFGVLENAKVYNLKLVNINVHIITDEPCFIGGFAGYINNSLIENCEISGRLTLECSAKMMGVGGMVGFGNGDIKKTISDMTLICIDKNVNEKDEQFMGGAYGAGYVGIDHCTIGIDGYVSDHGYVHNGGMVGMFAVYPAGNSYKSYITYNSVEGQITFFEDNTDRRAYCKAYVGENLHWSYEWGGCTENFKSNEVFDYSKDLYPCTCGLNYTENVVESTDDEWGYTVYECSNPNCHYSYKDKYTLKKPELERLRLEKEEKEAKERESISKANEENMTTKTENVEVAKNANNNTDSKKTEALIFGATMCALLIILVGVVLIMARKR